MWTPWTQIISEKEHMELLEKKGRQFSSSVEFLTQMCWEEVPQIDEASLSAGPWRISPLLHVRCNAFALWERCHLASHKTYDAKPLACDTQQYATDSGLRAPNLPELMAADRLLMDKNYQLVNEENCNLDDALHEYSSVRHYMVAALQPRPKSFLAAATTKEEKESESGRRHFHARRQKAKGDKKCDKKGDSKGEGKNRSLDNWDQSWFTQGTDPDGQTKPICMRHN